MLDYKNMDELANHRVWLPFHFLPGNNLEPCPPSPPVRSKDEFLERCICRPNSHPAQDMMRAVIQRQDRPYAIYRLGIATHVFVDTWAHQGFVGYQHRVNMASDIKVGEAPSHAGRTAKPLQDFLKKWVDRVRVSFVREVLPLGHGSVLSYPDRPYLQWSYTNGLGKQIKRDNPKDFMDAAREIYQIFQRYRNYPKHGDKVWEQTYDDPKAFDIVKRGIENFKDEDGKARHQRWLAVIADGELGFSDNLSYTDKGTGSWKAQALGTDRDIAGRETELDLPQGFLTSHWKLFHDALQAHRFFVLHEMLPKYGLLSG
jgi:hypothetical protein